jgi:outer membrane protein assembly factor BamB
MTMKFRTIACVAMAVLSVHCLVFTGNAEAQGWPQLRGSLRNGAAPDGGQPLEWPEGGATVSWVREIGSGFSELLVDGNRLYTLFAEKVDSLTGWEYVASFDALTGEELWRTRLDSVFIDVDGWGDGPRSTPAMDEDHLYCFTGFGKLAKVSRADGTLVWTVDFMERFNSKLPRWGFSSSPLLSGGLVLMEAGGDQGRAFVGIGKDKGELVWSAGTGEAMYSSPILVVLDETPQVVFVNGRNMVSYTPQGDSLWAHTMPIGNPMASPLLVPPSRLFASANNGAGSFLIEPGNPSPAELFTSSAMKNDWSSSVYRDGFIYGFNLASLQCISATDGTRVWGRRGFGKGSLILVGDKLLVLSDNGVLSMVEASPEGFRELGSVHPIEGRSWTAPSYSDGRVYVRNHTHMACIELK